MSFPFYLKIRGKIFIYCLSGLLQYFLFLRVHLVKTWVALTQGI